MKTKLNKPLVGVSKKELIHALEESLVLQSHYAKLLNQYDGGERIAFDSPKAWIERLRECSQK